VLNEILANRQSTQLEVDLAEKLKEYSQEGITPLNDDEAEYLDKLYDHVAIDLGKIRRDPCVDETTRQRLVEARLHQGRFRRQVLDKWQRRCVVSGCTLEDILRASHIKPWRDSNTDERLDPANGLLLTANLDALFDRYLI
jgi:predicted restriction endonuclease